MRRIAIINQKGGVGKTTTTANLGAALARRGQRVLTVDIDPQANLSIHLNVEINSLEHSTYTLLLGESAPAQAIQATSVEGLQILPTNIDLSGAELELVQAIGRETILRDKLAAHFAQHGEPDFVFYDCPPSLGLLSINALAAADEVFIPVQTEFFALQGMTKLMQVVELVRGRINPHLRISGIIPCMVDLRTNLATEVLAELRAVFPGLVLATRIRQNIRLAEAPSHGKSIFDYAPDSSGAQDYDDLAAEVLGVSSHAATLLTRAANQRGT